MEAAGDCGIDALVEVHDQPELKRALAVGASFIGINNRNLATFQVDLRTTETLAPLIPNGYAVIGEGGIRWAEDISRVWRAGIHRAFFGKLVSRGEKPKGFLEKLQWVGMDRKGGEWKHR